jgi:hypothetical protein
MRHSLLVSLGKYYLFHLGCFTKGARGSVVVKALCCKSEGRGLGSSPDEVDFLN